MEEKVWNSKYFYGKEISENGLKDGYVDYGTFASAFDAIRCNDIMENTSEIGVWELYSGSLYDEETDRFKDIMQEYIVSETGANIIAEWLDDAVYYNEDLGMYVWCITHWGTPWSSVSTGIKIILED